MSCPDPADLDEWVAAREAEVGGVRPGCEKRIIWPGEARAQAAFAVLYLHGFAATGREISPVPERVAEHLGAPLFVTRLTGHGQDGAAMAAAQFADWQNDTAEALEVTAKLGRKVIVIGCSTGATLLTDALARHAGVDAVCASVMVSPNFGLRRKWAQGILDAPGNRVWAKWLIRNHIYLPIRNADHVAFWTVKYPARAVMTADDAVKQALSADLESIDCPAFFGFSNDDEVVNPAVTQTVMARWGGPVHHRAMTMGAGDDPMAHLVAGDIHSPAQTGPLVDDITAWLDGQGIRR